MFLAAGCSPRAPHVGVVGLDVVHGAERPPFVNHVQQWGWTLREEDLSQRPEKVYDAACWIVPCDSARHGDERSVDIFVRYVRDGGLLLCVVRSDLTAETERTDPEAWWINRLGARLGFKVLATTTRKPRNVAPQILGDWSEIHRTSWAANEVRLTEPGEVLVTDEDLRPMAVMRVVGRGRVAVIGHPALLNENPDLTRNLILYLAGSND